MSLPTDFKFGHVAFFGRGLQEYINMFDLNLDNLYGQRILDCSAGPSSFACESVLFGIEVIAADPMYQLTYEQLAQAVNDDAQAVTQKQSNNRKYLHPQVVPTSERLKSMEKFLADFTTGKMSGRYIAAGLPVLPFPDKHFEMAISANFLFEYSDIASGGMLNNSPFDYDFHVVAISELLRVSKRELRVYPLRAPGMGEHAYIQRIISEFQKRGYHAELQPVSQRDIVGAEEMLRIIISDNAC